MFQPEPDRPATQENATSFSEAFLYHDNPSDDYIEPCPMHADMGLLTIIPVGDGPAALEMFSWSCGGWVNVETSKQMTSDPRVCVVFPGDLLTAVTNGFFQPTAHRVVVRFSNFFLFFFFFIFEVRKADAYTLMVDAPSWRIPPFDHLRDSSSTGFRD
jgi:isopenicillin N synthase-like dioxygenase